MRLLKRSTGRTPTTEKTSGRRPYKELRTRVSGSLSKEPGHAGENVLACCLNYTASELRVNGTFGLGVAVTGFRTAGSGRGAPKKSPFGNGPKEGLGLVCRWTRKDHVIGKLSSFFKS